MRKIVFALAATLPGAATAQVSCSAFPEGPTRQACECNVETDHLDRVQCFEDAVTVLVYDPECMFRNAFRDAANGNTEHTQLAQPKGEKPEKTWDCEMIPAVFGENTMARQLGDCMDMPERLERLSCFDAEMEELTNRYSKVFESAETLMSEFELLEETLEGREIMYSITSEGLHYLGCLCEE